MTDKLENHGHEVKEDDPSRGCMADNTATKGMSHEDLVKHLATKGVIVKTSTKDE